MQAAFTGFYFTDLFNFLHDILLLCLIFRAGKSDKTAIQSAKGRRL